MFGVHIVAHTRLGWSFVCEPASARWLWAALTDTFPEIWSGCLMPNHLHAGVGSGPGKLAELERLLAKHRRRFGAGWDVGPPTAVHTLAIARRTAV